MPGSSIVWPHTRAAFLHRPADKAHHDGQPGLLPAAAWRWGGAAALRASLFLKGPEGMLMLRRHLSYLQKEGTRPSSCLVAVFSFDSFVQQRGTWPSSWVIDTDYGRLVGVVLFNHLEVDFDMKPSDRAAWMIVHVITMSDVAEVEDLDAIFRGEGGFGSSDV
ncbi:hypothetical protein VPH35_046603 [Triticum aestivum]